MFNDFDQGDSIKTRQALVPVNHGTLQQANPARLPPIRLFQSSFAQGQLARRRVNPHQLCEPRIGHQQRQQLTIATTQIQNPRHATRSQNDSYGLQTLRV